jgi:hypothetical protein
VGRVMTATNGDAWGSGRRVSSATSSMSRSSLISALNATDDNPCDYCGLELNAFQVADGVTTHPDCAEVAKLEGERL